MIQGIFSANERSRGILTRYDNSISKALKDVYPCTDWLSWKFDPLPDGYWDRIENQLDFMDWASDFLAIRSMSDWYRVSPQDLVDLGGTPLLDRYGGSIYKGSLVRALQAIYPEYDWLIWKFHGPLNGQSLIFCLS
jgi:hypothetical protein